MFSKKLKLSFVATLLAISPVAIVASCAQTTDNQESQTLLKATVFNAKDLGLNLEISKAVKEINETWLIEHKDQIFNGSTSNLNNANHRFLALNMMSRYEFKDPIWQEPNLDAGWIK